MARQRTYTGMPIGTYAALREQPCGQCGAEAGPDGNAPQRDRSVWCVPCATLANAAARRTCAVPSCERTAARLMGQGDDETALCGPHAKAAKRGLTATLLTGPKPVTRSTIIAAAQAA